MSIFVFVAHLIAPPCSSSSQMVADAAVRAEFLHAHDVSCEKCVGDDEEPDSALDFFGEEEETSAMDRKGENENRSICWIGAYGEMPEDISNEQ